ncbi:prepilin-type N-terminal cleavage/methylation domain-containing protein [Bdellovibrionota bacterium]
MLGWFNQNKNSSGFTLIEVMVAMAIIVIAFIALTNSQLYSQMTALRTKKALIASFLAEQKMTELSIELEGLPFSEIPEKEAGEFPEPHAAYKWEITSKPFEYNLGAIATGTLESEEAEAEQLSMVMRNISDLLKEAVREVSVTVYWVTGKTERKFALTTHVIDKSLKIPALAASLGIGGGP